MAFAYTSDDDIFDYEHRRPVLGILLWFTVVFGPFFAALNYVHGNSILMAIELGMAVYALLLLRVVRRSQRLTAVSLCYLLPFYGVMMYSLTTAPVAPSVFAWVLLIPILSYLLLGRLVGGVIALVFLGIAGVIFAWKFGGEPGYGNLRSMANVALAAACIFGFSHVYEISRVQAEHRLREMALTDPLTQLANRTRAGASPPSRLAANRAHDRSRSLQVHQ